MGRFFLIIKNTVVYSLSLINEFSKQNITLISRWVRLGNILAHEYLDVGWDSIKKFIRQGEKSYKKFLKDVKNYIKDKIR